MTAGPMLGPLVMDPEKLEQAKRDFDADQATYNRRIFDAKGQTNAPSPFDTLANGETIFNRWTAGDRNGAQYGYFDSTDAKGKKTRRPSWQAVPMFAYEQSGNQFDTITRALKNLQGEGFTAMQGLYSDAMNRIG